MAEIRPPLPAELDKLFALDHHVFGAQCFGSATMRQFFDIAGPLLQVAVEGGALIAYGLVLPAADPGVGWLMALAVDPDQRGAGLGEAVLEILLDQTARHDIKVVRLTVAPENHAAISLYERFGFTEERREEQYFGPGKDRIIMSREGGLA